MSLSSIDFHSVTSVYQRSSYPHIFVSSKMNVSPLNPLCFSTVPSPVPFSSVAEETCSPPAWNFSPTRLNDSRSVVSVPFFTRLSYLPEIPPLMPFSSGVSKASGQNLLPRISIVRPPFCRVYDPSLQRCPHDLDILRYILLSFGARVDNTGDALFHKTSPRLLTLSKKKRTRFSILF